MLIYFTHFYDPIIPKVELAEHNHYRLSLGNTIG